MGIFSTIEGLAFSLQPYLPMVLVTLCVTGFSVIATLAYVARSSGRKPTAAPATNSPAPLPAEEDGIHFKNPSWWSKTLTFFGFFTSRGMATSFLEAIAVLRAGVGGRNAIYQVPWYLLIGCENSGKTSLLNSLSLIQPLGHPILPKPGELLGCNWWFFDRGVVLDVLGKFLLSAQTSISSVNQWKHFFDLLSHFRVRRPADGIILTIPISEIYGPTRFDSQALIERGNAIFSQLALASERLGLELPVYIVLTKADLIKGFSDFASSFPPLLRSQILGWSNPYPFEEIFSPSWVQDAFDSMNESLMIAQADLLSNTLSQNEKDGVILFPQEFSRLSEPLSLYLTSIFKSIGYNHPYSLRGIYITGDSKEEAALLSSLDQQLNLRRCIAFADDIFRDKIFPESSLAHPGKHHLISSSRRINMIRVCMVCTALGLSYGIWKNYKSVKVSADQLTSVFSQLTLNYRSYTRSLQTATEADQFSTLYLDQQAHLLLQLLMQAQLTSFWKPFFPPSWAGQLEGEVQDILIASYNKIIIRAIYEELVSRARLYIMTPLPIFSPTLNTITLAHPLQGGYFSLLESYLINLLLLQKQIVLYDRLNQKGALQALDEILKYLFGNGVPASILENGEIYEGALERAIRPPIPFRTLAPQAQLRLETLMDAYVQALFGKNQSLVLLTDTQKAINTFLDRHRTEPISQDDLLQLYTQVRHVKNFLEQPTLDWLESPFFIPGPPYNNILTAIQKSALLGPTFAQRIGTKVNQEFLRFKNYLQSLGTPLTGPLFSQVDEQLILGPSHGVRALENALQTLLEQPFLRTAKTSSLSSEFSPEKSISWDPDMIQRAVTMVQAYMDFTTGPLYNYPLSFQDVLRPFIDQSTIENVLKALGGAQTLRSSSSSLNPFTTEDQIQIEVQNLIKALPAFRALLSVLKDAELSPVTTTLQSFLSQQVSYLLSRLEDLFKQENLFSPIDLSFAWWDGAPGAARLAFDVTSDGALSSYVELQKQRTSHLALAYAKPLLEFFDVIGFEPNLPDVSSYSWWKEIVQQCLAASRQQPGNSLQRLSSFIVGDLNTMTGGDCAHLMSPEGPWGGSGSDFFLDQLQSLRQSALNRCETLDTEQVLHAYNHIQKAFTQYLSGKAPFVSGPSLNGLWVTPEDLRSFIAIYDQEVTQAKTLLEEEDLKANEFLTALEDVVTFFRPYVAASTSPPTIPFRLEFRVNRAREINTQDLLNWSFKAGDSEFNLFSSSPLNGVWSYGTPVTFTFQWASDGPSLPMQDPAQPYMTAQGFLASYTFSSPWSLLQAALTQEASPEDFDALVDINPQTLRFQIPTQSRLQPNTPLDLPTRLYVRLILLTSAKGESQPIKIPFFPPLAPSLSSPRKP